MAKAAAKKKPPEDEVEVFTDVVQRSADWFALRLGVMTASRFATIMASGKDGGESVGRRKLMYQLAGEILTGETAETFRNEAMDRGLEMEPDARAAYGRKTFADLATVGFVKRTVRPPGLGEPFVVGCSPDSFVGRDGLLQIKTMRPELLIEVWKKGAQGFPAEHKAQCQGELWVTGRQKNDLALFYRGMPIMPTFTVLREEPYIRQIAEACERFDYELRALVKQLREAGR